MFTDELKKNLDNLQNLKTELSDDVSPGRLGDIVEQHNEILTWLLGEMKSAHESATAPTAPTPTGQTT